MARRPPSPRERDTSPDKQGPIARITGRIARVLRWLAFSLLVSIVIECLGMAFWWPEAGVEHSRAMLQAELSVLTQGVQESLLSDNPARFAASYAERARYVLFELTGIKRVSGWVLMARSQNTSAARSMVRRFGQAIAPYGQAVLTIVQVFAVRLAILILAMPTFALFSLVGLVDGLVRRDLRRWGGGRESSYLYHYAKKSVWRFVLIACIIYLALPFSLHPTFILLPFAILFAVSIGITASTFKKYL